MLLSRVPGSMDRLMDGTYGYDALNATHHFMPNKMLLGTEVCVDCVVCVVFVLLLDPIHFKDDRHRHPCSLFLLRSLRLLLHRCLLHLPPSSPTH